MTDLERADALCRELFDIRSDPATMVEFAKRETEQLRSVVRRLLESYLATFEGNKDALAHEAEALINGQR